jgi:hypothetical protein
MDIVSVKSQMSELTQDGVISINGMIVSKSVFNVI